MENTVNKHISRLLRWCFALFLLPHLFTNVVYASDASFAATPIHIHIFWSESCPHCKHALQFVNLLETKDENLSIHRYEVSKEPKNLDLLQQTANTFNISRAAIPFILIGSRGIIGYDSDATTGATIKQAILNCRRTHCADGMLAVKALQKTHKQLASSPANALHPPIPGDISLSQLSLPMLAIALGAADGFNPCALWVLVFLLGLLASVKSRARRWLLGSTFVITSALVYYLIMVAWLNTLLLLGFVIWVRLAIGATALAIGGWSIRQYFANPEVICRVSQSPARRAFLEKLRKTALSPSLVFAFIGIILLAGAVNVVELLCSSGIPATFTQILALNNLPTWQHHAYLGLYILVFMLDDLLLFFAAMLALEITSIGTRYARWSNLLGGIIMLSLGLMMIFKPEWLM